MPLNIEKNSYILLRIKTKTKEINTILIRNEIKKTKNNNKLMKCLQRNMQTKRGKPNHDLLFERYQR